MRSYRKVHNYLVGEQISRGPLSQVYVAYRTSDHSPVAVRLTSKRLLSGYDHERSILFNEKTLAGLLTHPHIVEIREVIESTGQLFQVMDLFPEGDLLTYASRRTLPILMSLRMIDELLAAVEYLHSLRLCHRDLKPENVLVTGAGHIKLTDFAFAGFCLDPNDKTSPCGSIGYAAPEVFLNNKFDGQKADIWSIGVLIYHLFAGHLPFAEGERILPSRIDFSDLPPDVAHLISQILRPKPSDRPSISQIRAHSIFDRLSNRCESAQPIDFRTPMANPSADLLPHLSEALDLSESEIEMRLTSEGLMKEKILHHLLAVRSPRHKYELQRRECPARSSLPQAGLLSENCPCLTPLDDRNVVVRAVVNFMLAKRFCVSGRPGGTKTLVLNRDGDDIHLDLNVSLPDGVAVSGDVASGLPVIRELEAFLFDEYGVMTSY
jgi:serine/threonine protein kinase